MNRSHAWITAVILGLAGAACDQPADSVVGRWERTRGQRTWVEFDVDGTFLAQVGSDTSLIRGTYTQQGNTITVSANYGRTMTLRDSILVVEDGTRYRRVTGPPPKR